MKKLKYFLAQKKGLTSGSKYGKVKDVARHGGIAQLGEQCTQSQTPPHNFINKSPSIPHMGV